MQQRQCFTQGENVELLAQYGLFLAKIATVVVAIAVIAAIIVNLAQRKKQRGELRVTNLSEHYKEMKESLAVALLDGPQQKQWHKAQKKKQKQTCFQKVDFPLTVMVNLQTAKAENLKNVRYS